MVSKGRSMYKDKRVMQTAGKPIERLVVILHGDMQNLEDLAERWRGNIPDAVFALPTADVAAPGDEMPTWFLGTSLHHKVTLKDASTRLSAYIHAMKTEYGLQNKQIILVGHGKGATLALYHGLREKDPVCALVAFGGDIEGFVDLKAEIESRPPVMLVHGEMDPSTPIIKALQNYISLENAGVPTNTCFRPQLGQQIDHVGSDAAMFFLQGVYAQIRRTYPARQPETSRIAQGIKLVIWDLDETLWDGTLDDNEDLRLKPFRADAIRRLNQNGIVSAICSKNDLSAARKALETFGLWDEFVFPRISFTPKGEVLKSLIADMQLKPANCVFIDDNKVNIAEARSALPDLHTLDATAEACDVFLQSLLDTHAHVTKSRVEEYRSLQARVTESQQFVGAREGFLESCDIHVSIAWKADLIDFAPRIEELINRTNQLNFLKTRVEHGKMVDFLSESSRRQCMAVFAWDKFGYHGLIGFIAIDMQTKALLHMAFSCRIMHMGIENFLLERVLKMFPDLTSPVPLDVTPYKPEWLKEEVFSDPQIRDFIMVGENMGSVAADSAKLRIMANCHSGTWAHFAGLRDLCEIDNFPRSFIMPDVLSKEYLADTFAPALVYQYGTDIFDTKWPAEARNQIDGQLYENCVREFCEFIKRTERQLLIAGLPRGMTADLLYFDISLARVEKFIEIWERAASDFDCVKLIDVDSLVGLQGMVDINHYSVESSQKIAQAIAVWFNALPSSLFDDDRLHCKPRAA